MDEKVKARSTSSNGRRIGEYLIDAGLLTREDLQRALELQRRTGAPLGRILVALGLVRRYDLYRLLARQWGLPFVDLLKHPPQPGLARRFPPERMLREGFIPLEETQDGVTVAVARRPDATLERRIRAELGGVPLRFAVTTDWDIDQAVRQLFRREVLDGAVFGLYYRSPRESAYTVFTRPQFFGLAFLLLALLFGLYQAPRLTLTVLNLLVNVAFMAGILFKFVVSFAGARFERWEPVTADEVAALRDDELPDYTILVPVYREANVIGTLMENLAALDYPREKLEILVLLEEDDAETLEAAKAARPPGNVRFVIVPDQIPKTKPKACNVGLFFARGEYIVIFDAEDRPEPDQLKKAVVAFRKGPPSLVCVQAALNYYNVRENFLTRMFTLEYSYWFDYILPGLYQLRLPIPLGGTSNHFRTEVLRELGGWDPFNVTEDADLGVRAAARGYTIGVINSTTFEEANSRLWNWIRQRSRWIKGYMQTTLVHLRAPRQLVRQVGWRQTLGFLLLVAGTPLTFLAAPPLWALYVAWLATGTHALDVFFPPPVLYISLFNLLFGNGIVVYLAMIAVFKRKYYDLIPWALLNPVYWVLHSVAAYKALYQLFVRPFYWEKTMHGISKELARETRSNPRGGDHRFGPPLLGRGV